MLVGTEANLMQGEPGLLQVSNIQCEHGQSGGHCGKLPDHVYLTFPLALRDFASQDWTSIDLNTIIRLVKGPLEGLKALHEERYMHRDVHGKNILVMSLDPPQAVLCDYGKARHRLKERDTRLGPIPTLAPEVDGVTDYNNKIDIWGIGYVCCWILFFEYQQENIDNNKPSYMNVPWYVGL